MAEQLDHLLEMSDLPNVEIKVMPHSVGAHRGLGTGAFEILRFPERPRLGTEPPTVYVEGYTGDLYLDNPAEIAMYDAAWADIWSAALDEHSSREFITTVRKDLA